MPSIQSLPIRITSFQPVQKDLKVIRSPREHPVNWVFMQTTRAPERFISWEFLQAARGLLQWQRGSLPPFLANLITASPMRLSKKSYIASNPFSWHVFQLYGDEPTQQPESTVLNHLEQKPRRGDFYGANFSQDERKDRALVWKAWKAALQSAELSGGKEGEGGKGPLLWGQFYLSPLQFRSSITAACPRYNSDGCRSDPITIHTSCTANS